MTNEDFLAAIVAKHRLFYAALTSPDDMLRPMFMAVMPDGEIVPIPVEFGSYEEKAMLCDRMAMTFRILGVKQYAFFSESWMATYNKVSDMTTTVSPSQREDRMEVIMTIVADSSGNKVGAMLEMVRDPTTGLVVELKETEFGPQYGGQFAEILD